MMLTVFSGFDIDLSIPVSAASASFAGEWNVYAGSEDYPDADDPDGYVDPLWRSIPGKEYTENGLEIVVPDWSDYAPKATLQTKTAVDLRKGVYLEVRIDDFSYAESYDKSVKLTLSQVSLDYQAADEYDLPIYAEIVIHPDENRSIEENGVYVACKYPGEDMGNVEIGGHFTPQTIVDETGKPVYIFAITYDERTDSVNLNVNGMDINTEEIACFSEYIWALDYRMYVGVTAQNNVKGGIVDFSILKYGTDKETAEIPIGNDDTEPINRKCTYAEPGDSAAVPENQPAIWINASPDSDTAYKLTGTRQVSDATRINWNRDVNKLHAKVRSDKTYMIEDFPYAMVMLRNYCTCDWWDNNGDWEITREDFECSCKETMTSSVIVGDIIQGGEYKISSEMSSYLSGQYNIGYDWYSYFIVDYTDGISSGEYSGRINGIDITMNGFRTTESERTEFDLIGIGWFRSVEEIEAFFDGKIEYYSSPESLYNYKINNEEAMITSVDNRLIGKVAIPQTLGGYPVIGIDDKAFSGCSKITSISIPQSITSINISAFSNCTSLASIVVDENNTIYSSQDGVLYNKAKTELIFAPRTITDVVILSSVTSIGNSAFSGCSKLTSITIPDSVTNIGNSAFYVCSKLTSITIPDSVTNIGNSAFNGCRSLTSITIPDSVTSIGDDAFRNCTVLESIAFGENSQLTSIGNYAFESSRKLTSIIIPNRVTSIGSYAFYKCTSLTSITIPDSVKSIGSYAFYYCTSLASITIGNSVTSIGFGAFADCTSLTSITIPDSVKSIGSYAFYNCTSLTSITIGNSVTSIGYYAFFHCTSLTSATIGDSVTSIGDSAFRDCTSLTSVTIGDSVTSIGVGAFRDCTSLTSVAIVDSVTSIDMQAFYGCTSLESITIPDSVTSIYSSAFRDCTSLNAVYITDIAKWCNISFGGYSANPLYYAHNLYLNGSLVTDLVIPSGVTSIGNYAFFYCTSLTSITIPDSVTSIGYSAFDGCTSLEYTEHNNGKYLGNTTNPYVVLVDVIDNSITSFDIPDRIKFIDGYAFADCTSLTSITIPNSVTSIGSNAFSGCTSLTSITIPDSVTSRGTFAFDGCTSLEYTEHNNGKYLGNTTNPYVVLVDVIDNSITSFDMPDRIKFIDGYAFYGCTSLTSITIPNSVTSIGSNAFSGCSKLASITIPDSVTNIGDYAFYGCSKLTSITIPDSVTSIDYYAFSHCDSLTSITIPDSVTSIGVAAFSNCTSLTSITIPDSVTSIGNYAFSYCTSLTSITIPDSVTSIGVAAFSNCTSLTSITIPDSVTSIGGNAFYGCSSLESITISDSVTSIGGNAFYGCSSNLVIRCHENSVAHTYPIGNSINFELIHFYGDDNICDICGKEISLAEVSQVSVTLDGDIGVNFYWTLADSVINDTGAYFLVTLPNGDTERILVSEASKGTPVGSSTEYYKITGRVAAKEMADNITVELFSSDDTLIKYGECSVRGYAELVFTYASDDTKLVELMKQMLNYGAASQMLFDYNTDDLANNILDENDKTVAAVTADQVEAGVLNGNVSGIKNEQFSCILETKTTLRHYFSLTNGAIDDYTFAVDGDAAVPVAVNKNGEEWYYVDIPNISAADFGKSYVFTISKDGEVQTISASVHSYINAVVSSDQSNALDDTVYAMYAYSQAAKTYFTDTN